MGNILKSIEISEKLITKKNFSKKFYHRIKEMGEILRSGYHLRSKKTGPTLPFNGNVLMALHNSMPYDATGYAIRSHQIIKHLKALGLNITAVTRLGYPWDLAKHARRPFEQMSNVDSIFYHRLVNSTSNIGGLESEYITQYADILAHYAEKNRASIIHASSNYLNGLAAAYAAEKTGAKSVYEMRGLWHLSRTIKDKGYEGTDHFHYSEIMELAAAKEADRVVVITHLLKDYLVSKGIKPEKIFIVPNAVDTQLFVPSQPNMEVKKKFNLKGRIVVSFIGSLTDYEGIDLLIEAVSRLLDNGLLLTLLIVGKGYSEKGLHRHPSYLKHKKYIQFTGSVPFKAVRDYYSVSDILAFPRKPYTVCRLVPPLKILEGMAMAKPMVVSDLPPITEMVKPGHTCLLVPSGDIDSLTEAIRTLAKSDSLRKGLGKAGMDLVLKERSWNKIARLYLDVYNSL